MTSNPYIQETITRPEREPLATHQLAGGIVGRQHINLTRWTRTCSAKSQQENHHHGRLYLVWGDTGLMLPTSIQSRESD